jgi:hypothetical protein
MLADSKIDGRTVSFTEFIDEMVKADKYTTFEKVKVRYDVNTDKKGMDYRFDNGGPDITVHSRMRLLDCDFDEIYWLVLRSIIFEDYLVFFNCKPVKAIFRHCTFKKTLRVYSSDLEFMDFDTCSFEHGFKLERSGVKDRMKFTGCSFSVNPAIPDPKNEYDMNGTLFWIADKNDALDLTIRGCEFNPPANLKDNPQYFLDLTSSHFSNLRLIDNKINANVDFSQSSVDNTFLTYDCSYNGKIMMDAFNLNPVNTLVQWSTVNGNRLAVYDPKSRRIFHGAVWRTGGTANATRSENAATGHSGRRRDGCGLVRTVCLCPKSHHPRPIHRANGGESAPCGNMVRAAASWSGRSGRPGRPRAIAAATPASGLGRRPHDLGLPGHEVAKLGRWTPCLSGRRARSMPRSTARRAATPTPSRSSTTCARRTSTA